MFTNILDFVWEDDKTSIHKNMVADGIYIYTYIYMYSYHICIYMVADGIYIYIHIYWDIYFIYTYILGHIFFI